MALLCSILLGNCIYALGICVEFGDRQWKTYLLEKIIKKEEIIATDCFLNTSVGPYFAYGCAKLIFSRRTSKKRRGISKQLPFNKWNMYSHRSLLFFGLHVLWFCLSWPFQYYLDVVASCQLNSVFQATEVTFIRYNIFRTYVSLFEEQNPVKMLTGVIWMTLMA